MIRQQGKFLERLFSRWFIPTKPTIEEVKERDVGIGQLQSNKDKALV